MFRRLAICFLASFAFILLISHDGTRTRVLRQPRRLFFDAKTVVLKTDTKIEASGGQISSTNDICVKISSALEINSWATVQYHKDIDSNTTGKGYDEYSGSFFNSLEEEDGAARSTIAEFNRVRQSVLTKHLLDSGFIAGNAYPTRRFTERMTSGRPLDIAVFGNSFTIGSNCGESSRQNERECAWPNRLVQRWTELFPISPVVNWHMWQENGQTSEGIAQKIPSMIGDFILKNATPDAIFLDNTITDAQLSDKSAGWFEVVVRSLVQVFPGTLIVSIISGVPRLVNNESCHPTEYQYCYQRLRDVQQHYGLTVVDVAEMVRILPHESETDQQDHLWPQAKYMLGPQGEEIRFGDWEKGELYWANFSPRVRKTKHANYPENHPPWLTHQYVADSIMYALLKTAYEGCLSSDLALPPPPVISEETVAPKNMIDACPICLSRTKTTQSIDMNSNDSAANAPVSVVCGDWRWVTDDRDRAGWQSDEYGSLIRFRLQMSADPVIALTYMASHLTFGDLLVAFQTSDKPPLTCGDILKKRLPSLTLKGRRSEFSLPKTTIFSAEDGSSPEARSLFQETVVGQSAAYLDLYVENPNTDEKTRIKIQKLSSC